jgi:hypothetical protein
LKQEANWSIRIQEESHNFSEAFMDVNTGMSAAMSPEPQLPVIHERRCPSCLGEQIKHGGHVIAGDGMIRSQHRCESCGAVFWFARKRIP